jgi:aconitate hydratase
MSEATASNKYNAETTLETAQGNLTIFALDKLQEAGLGDIENLPYSIKVLLESCLRNLDGHEVLDNHVRALAAYDATNVGTTEIAFKPGRVVLQDFTGVPSVVDLAALRSAMQRMGGKIDSVNPEVPCDLVIDHSVQVDEYGSADALEANAAKEFERNRERYELLKWAQTSFENFRVVPPATGIVHQVNLEYLASAVMTREKDGKVTAYPDSLVGTDSHTTMINGLGVTGWGVGGIEAEAVMLGQPIYMLIPEVVGFKLTGVMPEGATATDLVLKVTQQLRASGVVGKFVEFFGDGLADMPLPDRATIANMAPEYGATMGFFPIDDQTLAYLRLTGRDEKLIDTIEKYCKRQGLWREESRNITYTKVLELDMGTVVPALAGPKRPQDRIDLSNMKSQWHSTLVDTFGKEAGQISEQACNYKDADFQLKDGAVVIAAITSCTNTSNPSVLIAAGLVARKARALGLQVKPWVKTSLAPGSRVVTEYLNRAKLSEDLEALGFYTVGYGCTTCIGNSGPIPTPVEDAIKAGDLTVASVLSGNRNFEGRIHRWIKANYLASPPLVVAYALAGTVDVELEKTALGKDKDGNDVFLKDIWPTQKEISDLMADCLGRDQFVEQYADVFKGPEAWQNIASSESSVYNWSDASTYIQEPPFFVDMGVDPKPISAIKDCKIIAMLADSVTTDHISPAGSISQESPAGTYLLERGVALGDFNSFGSRRGNDRIMTRGTFGNVRIRNQLAPGTEGGFTTYLGADENPEGPFDNLIYDSEIKPNNGDVCTIYDASVKYQKHGRQLVVLAGKDYGMGSSRDWAAKGTQLLGIRAVIAESYERIHRSNLVFMGVLPLQFKDGASHKSLGFTGNEIVSIDVDNSLECGQDVKVSVTREDGTSFEITTLCRIDSPIEVDYYRNGGILHTVLRRMAKANS